MTVVAPTPDHPWLVADIGGTNARFGLVLHEDAAPSRVRTFSVSDYPSLEHATVAYLAQASNCVRPLAACFAVAGPVVNGRFRLTNAPWEVSGPDICQNLGLEHVDLINDFAALAASLPRLKGGELRLVGRGALLPDQPKAVVGPGTGLGVAGLVPVGDRWHTISSEGGHVDPPAVHDREIEVVRILRAEHGGVSAESLLSGPGLVCLYQGLTRLDGVSGRTLTPAEVCADQDDSYCSDALQMFCALLGSHAGNIALTFCARGGVFIGGGIAPRIIDVIEQSAFRKRFEAKLRMTEYVGTIATAVIMAPTPALLGAAAWLAQLVETE